METIWYILDENGNPKRTDVGEWSQWFATSLQERVLDRTVISEKFGIEVSTVFIGYGGFTPIHPGPMALWETAIFGPPPINCSVTFSHYSKDEALHGHEAAVATARGVIEILEAHILKTAS